MKKLLLLFVSLLFTASFLKAQDCLEFFPTKVGTVLVNKSYNADNRLVATTIYKVVRSNTEPLGPDTQINFTVTDSTNMVIDDGYVDARCTDGSFYLKMENRAASPEIISMLEKDTEIVGDFLDYPNTFAVDPRLTSDFQMDEGEYTIRSKTNKDHYVAVRVMNRKYDKDEKVTTPAGTFDAAKVTFNYKIIEDGKKECEYKGVEWYAPGAGIVRSETYDDMNRLQSYTVLTTLQ